MTTTSGRAYGRPPVRRRPAAWLTDGRAAAGWGVAYAALGAGCAVSGTALFGAARVGWVVAAVGLASAATGVAVARSGLRPVLRTALLALCCLAGAGAFSLLMDVITLLFGQGVDSVPGAVQHALAALGAGLLAGTARVGTAVPGVPAAARAGSPAGPPHAPPDAPPEASSPVRLAAWAGTLGFVPYVVMKLVWAFGGTFAGVSGAEMLAASERNGASGLWLTLESWGLDATALLAALGVFLLWGLVRPWGLVFPRWTLPLSGRRVPRWLPLAPALLGAGTLAPYGVVGVGYAALATVGLIEVRSGDFPTAEGALLVSWIGLGAFAVYGVALAVAARSYWRRTG
ncbi:hypothetical protein [Kitasatospora sp. NBC_00458]|uniref:hypothetical protein n=1 Tax=Kitasatospora sp. NBC_00458 TaxID=2903568 RepID=UPI002E180C07